MAGVERHGIGHRSARPAPSTQHASHDQAADALSQAIQSLTVRLILLFCRIECVACTQAYALTCISIYDLGAVADHAKTNGLWLSFVPTARRIADSVRLGAGESEPVTARRCSFLGSVAQPRDRPCSARKGDSAATGDRDAHQLSDSSERARFPIARLGGAHHDDSALIELQLPCLAVASFLVSRVRTVEPTAFARQSVAGWQTAAWPLTLGVAALE